MPDVKISTGVDASGVTAGLAQIRQKVGEIGAFVTNQFAGMFAIGSIVTAGREIIGYGSKIHDLAERYGVASKALQQFGNVAETEGSSLEGVASGFNKLTIAQSKALGGSEQVLKHFENLGITIEDLRNLKPEEIAEKIGRSSMNAADMVAIFGKKGLELIPTFQKIADGTAPLGQAIDDNVIKKLDAANDSLKRLGQNAKVESANAAAGFTDTLAGLRGRVQGLWEIMKGPLGHSDLTDVKNLLDIYHLNPYDEVPKAGDPKFIGPVQPPRAPSGGADDKDALLQAVKGNGSDDDGGSSRNSASLQDRLAKIERERYLDALDKEKQIEVIARERAALQGRLNEGKKAGTISDEAAAQTQLEIYERDTEIHKIRVSIAETAQKSADAATKEREAAAAEAERQQDLLAAAHETTLEMQQTAAGHADIAEQMKIQWEYQQKIATARADGNEQLAKELETQRNITLEDLKQQQAAEAKAKAAKAAADAAEAARAKEAERVQAFTDGMADLAQNLSSGAAASDPTVDALRAQFGPDFGTHGPAGGPNQYEQNIIRGREAAAIQANLRMTTAPRIPAASAAPGMGQIQQTLAQILHQLQDTHGKVSEPIG